MKTITFEGGSTYDVKDEAIAKLREKHPALDVSAELEKLQRFIFQKGITPESPSDFVRKWLERAVARIAARQAAEANAKPVATLPQKQTRQFIGTYAKAALEHPEDPENVSRLVELIETGEPRNYALVEAEHERIRKVAAEFHAGRLAG